MLTMPLILAVNGCKPEIPQDCFIAGNSTIVGDVVMGNGCSVWFNAVVRGDVNSIRIGDFSNIQDGAVLHGTYQRADTKIGSYTSIGHNAIVHGCHIGNYVLVGMGAIVMDGVKVEDWVMIGAGSVVLQNTVLESGYLYVGSPARKVKPLTDEQRVIIQRTANNYPIYAGWFNNSDLDKSL